MRNKKYFLKKYKRVNKFLQKKSNIFNHKKVLRKKYYKISLIVVAVLIVLSTALFSFDVFSQEADTMVLDMSLSADNYDSATKTFTDRSGSNNDGVSANSAVFETGRYGSVDGAMSFNGVSDYVEVPDDSSLNPSDGSFTISFWIKVPDWDGSHQDVIIKSSGTGANYQFYLASGWNGNCIFWFQDDRVYGNQYVYAGFDATDGDWHHIVGLIDREAEEFRSYSDGDYYNRRPFSNFDGYLNNITNSAPLNFGNAEFEGLIEDVRIYNYALTDQEVQDMYESEKVNYSASSLQKGLVGHWTMDEVDYNSSTNRLTDKTPYSRHGVAVGGTLINTIMNRMGQEKNLLVFTGNPLTSHLNIPDPVIFQDNKSWSINLWVYRQVPPGADRGGIGNRTYPTISFLDNNAIFWGSNSTERYTLYYGKSITNSWHMLTFNMNQNREVTLFVDGEQKNSATVANSYFKISSIGSGNVYDRPFKGFMDDVRIYDRTLLESEIQSLYDSYEPKISAGSLNKGLVLDMPLTLKYTKDETLGSEIMTDKTPYSNDGQNYGATITAEGASFDGLNDYIDAGNDSILQINDIFSVSFWVKIKDLVDSHELVSKGGGLGGGGSWAISYYSGNESIYFDTHDLDGTRHILTLHYPQDNNWHHIVCSFDNGFKKCWIDFSMSSSKSESYLINNTSYNVELSGSSQWRTLDGEINAVKIYNRALSETEVKSLYDKGRDSGLGMTIRPKGEKPYGTALDVAGLSCLDILDNNPSTLNSDGLYWINPGGNNVFQVYCDMTTDGGGWTLVGSELLDSININNTNVVTEYDENGGIIITSTATATGCGDPENSGNTIKINNSINWSKIRHVGEFYGRSSCFSINGQEHYGGQTGHGNLYTYDPGLDVMRNCYLTCEQAQFSNFTQRCDGDDANFYRFNEGEWKRFETILRREDPSVLSGISVGVSCNTLDTKWRVSEIYVK